MKNYTSRSIQETQEIAREWLEEISNRYKTLNKPHKACIVGLSGHLGVGKTAFVKAVAKELGVVNGVTSPTFVIMKSYEIKKEDFPWKKLIHIDAYRLENMEELHAIDFDRYSKDKDNLIMIEWPENVGLKEFETLCFISLEARG